MNPIPKSFGDYIRDREELLTVECLDLFEKHRELLLHGSLKECQEMRERIASHFYISLEAIINDNKKIYDFVIRLERFVKRAWAIKKNGITKGSRIIFEFGGDMPREVSEIHKDFYLGLVGTNQKASPIHVEVA